MSVQTKRKLNKNVFKQQVKVKSTNNGKHIWRWAKKKATEFNFCTQELIIKAGLQIQVGLNRIRSDLREKPDPDPTLEKQPRSKLTVLSYGIKVNIFLFYIDINNVL